MATWGGGRSCAFDGLWGVYSVVCAGHGRPHDSPHDVRRLGSVTFEFQVVRAFTDCILDLTTNDPRVVDLLGRDELVYLGPDENIIPQDIEWIVQRAEQRKYMLPQVFNPCG